MRKKCIPVSNIAILCICVIKQTHNNNNIMIKYIVCDQVDTIDRIIIILFT